MIRVTSEKILPQPKNETEKTEFLLAPALQPGRYRHFKGGEYQVLGTARNSETEEWQVLYYPLYPTEESKNTGKKTLWVRPLAMFLETVTRNGKTTPRFILTAADESLKAGKK